MTADAVGGVWHLCARSARRPAGARRRDDPRGARPGAVGGPAALRRAPAGVELVRPACRSTGRPHAGRGRGGRRALSRASPPRSAPDIVHLNSPALAADARVRRAGRRGLRIPAWRPGGRRSRAGPLPPISSGAPTSSGAAIARADAMLGADRGLRGGDGRTYGLPAAPLVVRNGRRTAHVARACRRALRLHGRAALGRRQEPRDPRPRGRAPLVPVLAAGPLRGPERRTRHALACRGARPARATSRRARISRAGRSSSRPPATSRSASRCSRRPRPAAPSSCPTSRPSASSGTARPCSSCRRRRPARSRRAIERLAADPTARAASARPRQRARGDLHRRGDERGDAGASIDRCSPVAPHASSARGCRRMKFVYFTHSLASCWNHGNAHFLRGVLRELSVAGTRSRPRAGRAPGASRTCSQDHGEAGLDAYRAHYPELSSQTLRTRHRSGRAARRRGRGDRPRVERAVARRRDRPPAPQRRAGSRSSSTTPTTAPSAIRTRSAPSTSTATTACSPSARHWRRSIAAGAGATAFTSGTRLRTRACSVRLRRRTSGAGLVWIGNWGDDERSAELESFLFRPAQTRRPCRSTSTASAIRTTPWRRSRRYGARYRGWLPNAARAGGLRAPSRDRARAAPLLCRHAAGHSDDPRLRGAGLRHSAGLARPGATRKACSVPATRLSSSPATRPRWSAISRALANDADLRRSLVASGLDAIRSRHTCAHRVDELLAILATLGAPRAPLEMSA